MPELCNPGATIVAALNSPFLGEDFLHDCMAQNLPESKFIEWIEPAVEFEETDPDKRLKIALYKLAS